MAYRNGVIIRQCRISALDFGAPKSEAKSQAKRTIVASRADVSADAALHTGQRRSRWGRRAERPSGPSKSGRCPTGGMPDRRTRQSESLHRCYLPTWGIWSSEKSNISRINQLLSDYPRPAHVPDRINLALTQMPRSHATNLVNSFRNLFEREERKSHS